MSRPSLHMFALLLVLTLAAPLAAGAQQPASQNETVTAPQEATVTPSRPEQAGASDDVQPIEEGEIPSRAELVSADLRRIETLIQPTPEIAAIESARRAREAEMVKLRAQLNTVDPNQVSQRRLGDHRLPWLQLEDELADWEAVVRRRFETLWEEREFLRGVRSRWELTAAEAESEGPAPELAARVDAVLTDVLDVESRVRERRNAVGSVAGRITSMQEIVSDSLHTIDEIGTIVRTHLFTREAPPLWRSFGATEAPPLSWEAMDSGRRWVRALLGYVGLRSGRVVLVAVWFFVLLLGILRLRREASGWPSDDADSERFHKLLARPFSMALGFALAAALLILPYPVGSTTDVLMLVALVPILRVGSVVLSSTTRRSLYGIATLMLMARLSGVGPDASLATRLLLLVVTAAGFFGAALAVLRGRKDAGERSGWLRAVHAGVSAAAVLLGVALIANILGWVQLAKMLTEATISSLFSAFGWAILVAAAATLFPPAFGGWYGQRLPSLRRNQAAVARIKISSIRVVALVLWLQGALARFQIWAPLREYGARIAASEFSIGGLTISTGGVLGASLVLFVTWLIARIVSFMLREEVTPRLSFRRGAEESLITLVNYTVYAVGVMIAASAVGLSGTQLAVVFGALSLGIGFGLQTIVNNFVSGLILIFERPIKVGDVVQTTDRWGKVQHIGIRASTIRSFDGAEIVIPNGDLIAKEVVNWTRTDEIRRAEVLVGVAYGTDPETVLEILLRVAEEHPKVRQHPEPRAQMIRFGDSSLDFRLRCWTLMDDWIETLSDLHVAVNRELNAAGLTIPFPQRDLHVIPPRGEASPETPPELDTSDHPPLPEDSEHKAD